MNIVLIGLKHSGKTSVGKALAARLHKQFIDTDCEIIRQHERLTGHKQTIRDICQYYGEAYFRDLEQQVICKLSSQEGLVIATGGGAVTQEQNVVLLKKKEIFFYLALSFSEWEKRVQQHPLPTFISRDHPAQDLAKHYAERTALYAQSATVTIEGDGQSTEAVVRKILISFKG